jgi:hypothetical protein
VVVAVAVGAGTDAVVEAEVVVMLPLLPPPEQAAIRPPPRTITTWRGRTLVFMNTPFFYHWEQRIVWMDRLMAITAAAYLTSQDRQKGRELIDRPAEPQAWQGSNRTTRRMRCARFFLAVNPPDTGHHQAQRRSRPVDIWRGRWDCRED